MNCKLIAHVPGTDGQQAQSAGAHVTAPLSQQGEGCWQDMLDYEHGLGTVACVHQDTQPVDDSRLAALLRVAHAVRKMLQDSRQQHVSQSCSCVQGVVAGVRQSAAALSQAAHAMRKALQAIQHFTHSALQRGGRAACCATARKSRG